MTTSFNPELPIIPANVPVPNNMIATGDILFNPKTAYSFIRLIRPMEKAPTIPPMGRATIGSMTISNKGRNASNKIAVTGATTAGSNNGNFSPELFWISLNSTKLPLLASFLATQYVTIIPKKAGIIPAAITDVSGTLNASAAAIEFGFGDIIFPAFPPPIIASKIAVLERPARLPIAKAIGATVITATSMNTPTVVKIMVAIANAKSAFFSPIALIIDSAIVEAAPD